MQFLGRKVTSGLDREVTTVLQRLGKVYLPSSGAWNNKYYT